MLTYVSDPNDERLADYFQLTDVALRSRHEPAKGLFIAESPNVIARAVAAGHRPRSFLMAEKWLPVMRETIAAAPDSEGEEEGGPLPVFLATESMLREITGFHLHRGALAAVHRPTLPTVADLLEPRSVCRVAVLEDIVDHTNVGAIFRSAAGLGVDAVVVTPRCGDPLYRRSVRVSMGTVFQVPWTRIGQWPQGIGMLHEHGFTVAALGLGAESRDLDDFVTDCPQRLAVVLGAEGDGLKTSTVAGCDVALRIPMSGGVDSLNVASAAAVAFWATR